MCWEQVTKTDYEKLIGDNASLFHSVEFNELNSGKVDEVILLVSPQMCGNYGLIVGRVGNNLRSPFSSPFGGIVHNGHFDICEVTTVVASLLAYLRSNDYSLKVTFSPFIYDKEFIKACADTFLAYGFSLSYSDVNFHLALDKAVEFVSVLERNARKNLNQATQHTHRFYQALNQEDMVRCYEIIKTNRAQKGFPLKLSFDDIMRTGTIVPIDFFILEMKGIESAAAIVFNITRTISMVVYWGNIIESNHFRPMNLLPYYLYNHYRELDREILDIGPSSEFGIVNEGLASFKKSIGCVVSQKHTFTFDGRRQ